MLPTSTPNYGANDMSLYPILFAKHLVSYPARDVFAPDSYHVAIGQGSKRAAVSIDIPIFGNHVSDVIAGRAKKQVGRVDATRIVAGVTHKVFAGINSVVNKVRHAVREGLLVIKANHAVPVTMPIAAPLPTVIGFSGRYISPERIGNGSPAAIMPIYVSDVLTLHPAFFFGGACGNWGDLPTPAHAQAGQIGRFQNHAFFPGARAVMLKKAERFSLNHLAILARNRCNVGLLAASAVAIAVWNIIGIGGIIGHTDISLVDIGHVPGRSNVAGISITPIVQPNVLLCKEGTSI